MTALFQTVVRQARLLTQLFGLACLGLHGLYLIFLRREEYVLFTTGLANMA